MAFWNRGDSAPGPGEGDTDTPETHEYTAEEAGQLVRRIIAGTGDELGITGVLFHGAEGSTDREFHRLAEEVLSEEIGRAHV